MEYVPSHMTCFCTCTHARSLPQWLGNETDAIHHSIILGGHLNGRDCFNMPNFPIDPLPFPLFVCNTKTLGEGMKFSPDFNCAAR